MKRIILSAFLVAILSGCNSFLDLKPIDFPTEETFYTDVKGLEGGIIGAYDELQSSDQYGAKFMTLMETRGDNVKNDNSGASGGITYQIEVFTETPANSNLSGSWLSLYTTIYRCNLILQNMDNVQMNDDQRTKIAGQASFIRALCYFNLVRLWGNVPVITHTQTVEEARNNKRAPVSEAYAQIVKDLTVAKALPATWPEQERGRATSYAAQTLLAKVYLYQGKTADVITELTPVVAAVKSGKALSLVPMPLTFPNDLKTSKDIIFAVQYLKGGVGESAHQNNRYRNNDNGNIISLEPGEFESNADNRKALVAPTGSGQRPGKFNAPATNNETSADFPVLRCAEVMLMYAEALNETTLTPTQGAFDALNAVRKNAGLSVKSMAELPTKEAFRKAVYKERRLELALECDRWFDLVRTRQFATVFPGVDAYRQLYPIPQAEIENVNDATGWQNEGYTIK
ncbi:RagB/SusD family nutrient uptake outer membrane protein [Bacteroides sp.]|uniref:RagB/SusD family nutrient uptake outer membrane protein n=2 Tax=Bacteroides sp. TaxID=29523 RepID=UPI002FCBF5D2